MVYKYKKAVSTIEYMTLFVLFLAAILVMQKSIARSFFGRWKDLGDSFGQGEQYDPRGTVECGRYVENATPTGGTEIWYLQKCYEDCLDVRVAPDQVFGFHGSNAATCRVGTEEEQILCCAKGCEAVSGECDF